MAGRPIRRARAALSNPSQHTEVVAYFRSLSEPEWQVLSTTMEDGELRALAAAGLNRASDELDRREWQTATPTVAKAKSAPFTSERMSAVAALVRSGLSRKEAWAVTRGLDAISLKRISDEVCQRERQAATPAVAKAKSAPFTSERMSAVAALVRSGLSRKEAWAVTRGLDAISLKRISDEVCQRERQAATPAVAKAKSAPFTSERMSAVAALVRSGLSRKEAWAAIRG